MTQRPAVRSGRMLALAVALLVTGPVTRADAGPAAHARLVASEPASGDTLTFGPERIRLVFSEPVDPGSSEILLITSAAHVERLQPERDSSDVRALVATAPRLARGAYRVSWRVLSADGHPVAGDFVFFVRAGDDPSAALPGPPPRAGPGSAIVEPSSAGTRAAAATLRGLGVGSLLALAGLLAFLAWIAPGGGRRPHQAAIVLTWAAAALLAAHLWAWWRFASGQAWTEPDSIRTMLETAPGRLELLRVGLACGALWALALARRPGMAAVFAAAGVAIGGAIGHAFTNSPLFSVPAKSIHLVASGLWLGGLLWLVLADPADPRFLAGAHRVSALAFAAVLAIAVTGAIQVFVLLQRPSDLIQSGYGALVLAKVGGLLVLTLFGARHRFRLLPRAREISARTDLRRSVRVETAILAGVILLAGVLAYVSPPGPAGRASSGQISSPTENEARR